MDAYAIKNHWRSQGVGVDTPNSPLSISWTSDDGTYSKVGGGYTPENFVVTFTFLAAQVQLVVLVSTFVMASTV